MKYFVFVFAIIVAMISCQGNDVKMAKDQNKIKLDTPNFTTIQWIDSLKDIGEVPPGKITEVKFRFKNSGDKPLLILAAKPGCGCTVADYPKNPIPPGKEGVITANYDVSKGGAGEFRKNIRVTTNTKGSTETFIFFYGRIKGSGESSVNKQEH
jgi:hypothetical protein